MRTIRHCIKVSCNRRDNGQWLPGDRPLSLWQQLQTTRFPSSLRGHRCCSCEPSRFGEDRRSAIIQLLVFRRSLLLRFSEHQISVLCQTRTYNHVLLVEQQRSSPCRKFAGATQKKKIRQTTKSKTSRLESNALRSPSKDGREGFVGIQLRLSFHQIRTLT
jgi:hypothetical protein